ncbi:hypothetical protein [Tranquillimonas rosea]|uniref:hypothetical protein n=1 Tax=Tranquillimonas rosea TaxID=641238 RepID=UPI003BAC520A
MAKSFTASMRNWSNKAKRNAGLVVMQSVQDVGNAMIRPEDGIMRGAPFKAGILPVDDGDLLASSFVAVGGSVTARGSKSKGPDFTAALAGIETGETIIVALSSPYARRIEYGWGSLPGRLFTRQAVQQWEPFVQANAAKLKD